ncbi:hypothetical protein BJY52DRAFT_1197709 [Lactarius psammicola]|nr:hypothetical protein BJY52DRAFT_1197709 [Lactarius psammicola]
MDEHLHTIVQPPASVIRTNELPQLKLNCLVLGGDRNHIFPLKIPGTETVGALRDAIKDKKKNAFHHVDADTIILWRSMKLDEDSLSPTQELSEVYSDPPLRKHVHIVVKPPPARLPSQPLQASKFATIGKWTEGLTISQLEAVVYDDETSRIEATRVFLEEAIGHPIPALDATGEQITLRFDGACTASCGNLSVMVALKEDKNEVGTGGCDPSHQCAMGFRSYYTRKEMVQIRDRCCCPSFLIALAGTWIYFIWIGGHPYDDDKLVSVTRTLASLGAGITELRQFYGTLHPFGPIPDFQRFFPFIRQYCRRVYFQLLVPGLPPQENSGKPPEAIFIATTEPEIGRESRKLVIKYVQRYNADAYRILATKRRDADLIYYSKEDPNAVDLAGLSMVVMEHIDGENVEAALGTLHEENMVFGDLRYLNIMVKDGRAMFIDFDWCGEHEKDTYPVSLNDARDTNNSINWHHKVERGGKMAKDHDIFMLNDNKFDSENAKRGPQTMKTKTCEEIKVKTLYATIFMPTAVQEESEIDSNGRAQLAHALDDKKIN